jgi:hypothetical protein
MINRILSREYLYSRHRLSHQQIDCLLGEGSQKEFLAEKMQILDKIKYFIPIIDLLQKNDIPFLCLKGPVLSQQLYNDPSVRLSHDVDLLLSDRADMDRVNRLLVSQGYLGVDNLSWPEESSRQKLLMDSVHHLAYVHQIHKFMVEIHWSVYTPFPIRAKQFWRIVENNRQQVSFLGREVTVFAPELNLLYLVIHGSKHGWQRLKWLIDIKDFPFETIDPAKWKELMMRLKAERMVSQAGFLMHHFFNIAQPLLTVGKMPLFLKTHPLKIINEDIPQQGSVWSSFADLRYRLLLCKSCVYKLRVLQSMAISTGDLFCIRSSSRIVYLLYRPYSYIKRRIVHA